MILTDVEKNIIQRIESEDIKNIDNFLYVLACKHSCRVTNLSLLQSRSIKKGDIYQDFVAGDTFYGYTESTDITTIKQNISTFASIIKFLEDHKFVSTITLESSTFSAFLKWDHKTSKYYYENFISFNDIIFQLKDVYFFPTPLLTQFINNGYCTNEEIKQFEDAKERNKNYITTIGVAAGSIIVSALFNYLMYTNTREVHINNTEPTKIEIKNIDTNLLKYLTKPDTGK